MTLFDNKQVIHIAAECAVLVVITFYFSLKHRQLLARVAALSNRVKEQEMILQKHEKILKNHDNVFRNLLEQQAKHTTPTMTMPPPATPTPATPTPATPTPATHKSPEKIVLPVAEKPTIEIIETEIEAELNELEAASLKSKDKK